MPVHFTNYKIIITTEIRVDSYLGIPYPSQVDMKLNHYSLLFIHDYHVLQKQFIFSHNYCIFLKITLIGRDFIVFIN
jgi:hypothetical protein